MTFDEISVKLNAYRIGIAGAGGLGSNCAMALVRSGIGELIIADFDRVTASNLNRQFYFADQLGMKKVKALADNLLRINPHLVLKVYDRKLLPADIIALYKSCDVIVEAFDDADQKQMLIETVSEHYPDKPLVVGSGMAGWGESNQIKAQQFDNLYICGDQHAEVSGQLPPLAPRVGIVANMQANGVLEILLGKM